MTPTTVTRLPLDQIASQQQDAIIFDVSSIPSLGNENIYLIFYLSKEDERNGYGTVIQLDSQTKQAAIYADLNPEYTYLFYKNDQDQLQTLMWCIEVATQTSDELFIAHAKVYGRGISAEDLKRFNQVDLPDNQPQAQHALAESYAPSTPPQPVAQPSSTSTPFIATQPAAAPPMPTQPAIGVALSASAPVIVSTEPTTQTPVNNNHISTEPMGPSPTSIPVNQPTTALNEILSVPMPMPTPTSIPTPSSAAAPVSAALPSPEPVPAPMPNPVPAHQPPVPTTSVPATSNSAVNPLPPAPTFVPNQPEPASASFAPAAANPSQPLSFINDNPDDPNQAVDTELNLPPLATQQLQPTTTPIAAPVEPTSLPANILQPIMPSMQASSMPPQPTLNQTPSIPKQPVGRPPKPLLQDQLWPVSPADFIWVKNMSRQPISDFQEELHQKVIQQIRTHGPGLMEDWQFTGLFEQAFGALCTSYELIPALRHDILKALLNGRVVENIKKTQQGPSALAATL